jgi:hypothetical protein
VAQIGGELNPAAGPMPAQQFGQKFFVDRYQALVEFVHLVFVIVDAQDPVADLSEACGRH